MSEYRDFLNILNSTCPACNNIVVHSKRYLSSSCYHCYKFFSCVEAMSGSYYTAQVIFNRNCLNFISNFGLILNGVVLNKNTDPANFFKTFNKYRILA